MALLSLTGAGCRTYVVENGAARADIVLPVGAPQELERAAREISAYAQKTSGTELKIRRAADTPSQPISIRLSVAESLGEVLRKPDSYTIKTDRGGVVITGGSPRGALYGAYDFIERVFGVRWFMPTIMGEDLIPRTSIELDALDVTWNPAFDFVGGLKWAGGPGADDWELRMRASVGRSGSFGHNWHNVLQFTPENVKKYPTAFAEVDGKRGSSPQLCTEDPDAIRLSVEAARRHFDANKDAVLFSISPNDGYGWCEDDRCRKIDERYDVADGTLSDRFTHYANAVNRELEKTHPGKQLAIYGYVNHTKPPQRAKPFPGYTTELARTPWEFCHVHALDDPSCPENQRFLGYISGWAKLTKHTGIYDYYGHFFMFTPWPIVHTIRRDIPLLHSLGIERFTSETQQNWSTQGLNFYVAAKLLANPATNVDALLDEYYTRFYGAAREPMKRYWERFETEMQKTVATGDSGYAWISMWRRPLIEESAKDLAEAEKLAKTDVERIQTRVAFARLGFSYTEAIMEMMEAHFKGDLIGVLNWTAEAQKRLKRTEGSAPQALFIYAAIGQTNYLSSLLTGKDHPWVTLRPPKLSK